ncbi:hypothetical protein PENTCL1PPCAC_26384, partial [Pristionchus entomophagus]
NFYRNQSKINGRIVNNLPEISDPPLGLNIYATHFRSAYPFVQNGRRMKKPDYHGMINIVIIIFVAALLSMWVVLGYDILPASIGRQLRLYLAERRKYIFKGLASRKNKYASLFYALYLIERIIRNIIKKVTSIVQWIAAIESTEDEETRQYLMTQSQDQPTQDTNTPLLSEKDKRE